MTAHRLPSNKPGMAAENRLPPEEPLLVIDKLTPTSKLTNKANLMKVPSLALPLFDQLDSAAFFRRPVRGFDGNYAALQTEVEVGGWWDSTGTRLVPCLAPCGELTGEMTAV